MRTELDDARERDFWRIVLRVIGTALVVVLALGTLAALTVLLGWSRYLLLCAIGLLAGLSLSIAALGSARSRELTALVLGAITLPALAALLAVVGAQSDAAYGSYRARVVPFLAHAIGAVLAGVTIAALWRGRRRAVEPVAEDSAPQALVELAASPLPAPASVEQRSVRSQPPGRSAEGATP